MAPGTPIQGRQARTLLVSYIETSDPLETAHNQLLALFMRASPTLANLVKNKGEVYTGLLAEYFDNSANAHWATLFPKSRRLVKEPSVTEAADFKKISSGLASLAKQIQSIGSRLSAPSNQSTKAPAASYAAATASRAGPTPTSKKPTPNPTLPRNRPRVVIRYPNQSAPLDPPIALIHKINTNLESLGHKVKLSAAHRTTKGNLVLTADPDTTEEALWAATPALQSILSLDSRRPTTVYRDVKWSRVLLHNVCTGKSTPTEEAFTPDQIHEELIAHNPLYRGLRITQRPSWVRPASELEPHSRSSLVFSFEDPDSNNLRQVMRNKVFYLFGDRSPIRSWKKNKPARKRELASAITPRVGSNTTERTHQQAPTAATDPLPPTTPPTTPSASASRKGKQKQNQGTGTRTHPKAMTQSNTLPLFDADEFVLSQIAKLDAAVEKAISNPQSTISKNVRFTETEESGDDEFCEDEDVMSES